MAYFEFKTNPLYVQGPDAILELKGYSYHLGERFLIVTGCGPITQDVVTKVKQSFDNSMESNLQKDNLRYAVSLVQAQKYDKENKKITYNIVDYEGKQVTVENIAKLTEFAKNMNADVIIGIGGGKVLDLVRGVHHYIGCKVVLCPTSAASNAPASTLTVLYNDNDEATGILRMDYHPSLVLTDINLIINAPPITVTAGIGDCMGTYFESVTTVKDLNRRNKIVDPAWHALQSVKQVFYDNGYQAVLAAKSKVPSLAYETVISQIVHISGPNYVTIAVHFSHVVNEALLHFKQCKKLLHGILVGYGVIPFLVRENYPMEEFYEYIDFCISIGLPVTFEELGIKDESKEELMKAAQHAAMGAAAKMASSVITAEDLYGSMLLAENLVNDYLGRT